MPHKDPEARRAYIAANRERMREVRRAWRRQNAEKIAAGKRERYHSDPEYRAKRLLDERERRLRNLDAARERDRQRRLADPEKFRERAKAQHVKHTDRIKAYQAKWRNGPGKDKERSRIAKWNEQNAERRREIARDYAARNPERYRAACHKRRAMKQGAEVGDREVYRAFVKRIRTAEHATCYWCGRAVAKRQRNIDHVIPLARGGADDVHNLCCSCAKCNRKKNAKLPHEFCGQHVLPFGAAA